MKEKLSAIARAILLALVILTGAIAVPILFRPFFHWHIEAFDLPELTGLTVTEIKTAYKEMLDYCIGLADTFSVGVLPFSESGAAHFADVKKLFLLDLSVLAAAVILLIGVWFYSRRKPVRLLGHTPGFWSAMGLGVTFLTVGGLAALDFDRAFAVFHKLFFPGKDNWIFSSVSDPVIKMLPAEFFRNCAVLILVLVLISCAGLLLWDRKENNMDRSR